MMYGITYLVEKDQRASERAKIGRYSMYEMRYRWSLEEHVQQLRLMVEATLPFLKDYLLNETLVLAYVDCHDDPEIYPKLGDVQAAYKAVMNPDEKSELDKLEEEAVQYVVEKFNGLRYGEYDYGLVLHNYRRRFSPEAQLVHFLDKVTAFCEAMHEIFAGNPDITMQKLDPQGRETKNPFQGYPYQTERLLSTQPFLRVLRWRSDVGPFMHDVPRVAYITILNRGQPHTAESVQKLSVKQGVYSDWLRLILESGNQSLIERLYTPNTREFANCRR